MRKQPRNLRKLHNMGECEAVCAKGIKLEVIARMNRNSLMASVAGRVVLGS